MASETHDLIQRFVSARRDPVLAVLEGFHAVKHAVRFGAAVEEVAVLDGVDPDDLPAELTGSTIGWVTVAPDVFDRLVPSRPPLPIVALAARPATDPEAVLGPGDAPVVLLEQPTHAGNVGAAVRVAAAAGADGLLVHGDLDPWSPAAIRGGAGLQYALPVTSTRELPGPAGSRPLVVFDPQGCDMREEQAPPGAVLGFGTERRGVSIQLLERADLVVSIPMREQVSSLNLATSVAIGLYAWAVRPT